MGMGEWLLCPNYLNGMVPSVNSGFSIPHVQIWQYSWEITIISAGEHALPWCIP